MVEFAGWKMPIQFAGLIHEHSAVRNHSGIFDISHMGVVLIQGSNSKDGLQKLVPSDLYRIGPGEACYTVLLNEEAGIVDDVIIYDLGVNDDDKDRIMMIINAANTEEKIAWLEKNLINQNLQISDKKENNLLLAIQGPESKEQLIKVLGKSFVELPRFGHKELSFQFKGQEKSTPIFIARTGYTGENGYELLIEQNTGIQIWNLLIQNGVTPCGLGARDTLRLEAAMPLYGNELNLSTSPLEAGLGWLVHLEVPGNFIGKKTLAKQVKTGVTKKLVGLELEGKAIARSKYPITYQDKIVGQITSGSWSPTLNKGIAMAYLPIELTKLGTIVSVIIRDKIHKATVVKKPFYRRVS